MNLRLVIDALRERILDFGGRVYGAAEFAPINAVGQTAIPAAWVVPMHDQTHPQKSQTDYWQNCDDCFSVIVVLSNQSDELGFDAVNNAIHVIRSKLFGALLGWRPAPEYTRGIEYVGGILMDMNRAVMYYKFDFMGSFEITEEMTWQFIELSELPFLETVHVNVDLLDPGSGPDGTIEFQADFTLPTPNPKK
ncbi:hypothetical protein I6H07_07410 [Hafnia alvei]|uniref:phage tail terminator protein n=1 Tax=Hafnia alvei TaxID=569 RepID=UPI000B74F647|nr:hypothetical protein [Hafnia alvei]MBI0275664.1 hypothetical protein [Hafnia alvei]PNK98351.1 hypothetical protein CEQ28_012570 [Hafnia alvei]